MPYLDPVVQEFIAQADRYIAPVKDMARVAEEARIANDNLVSSLGDLEAKGPLTAASLGMVNDNISSMSRRVTGLSERVAGKLVPALMLLDVELDKKIQAFADAAGGAAVMSAAISALAAKTGVAAAAPGTDKGGGGGGGAFGLTQNALHWIIAGGAEIAAVVIPAMIATTAMLADWAQAAVSVEQHMRAVYTATEATKTMFGITAGQAIGLGNSLQKAQNAANPQVYQALGGILNILHNNMGNLAQVGLRVGQVFDRFIAQIGTNLKGSLGGQLHSLLGNMVTDVTKIGQVFSNAARAVVGFAAQMPGLANVLLSILDTVTHVIAAVINFVGKFHIATWSVLTAVMAFEEFNRWGGLLFTGLTRLGLASGNLATGMFSIKRAGQILVGVVGALPTLVGKGAIALGNFMTTLFRYDGAFNQAGQAVNTFGQDLVAWAKNLGPLQALLIAFAAAAIGFLIYKLVTAKSAAQQYVQTLNQMIANSANLAIFTNFSKAMAGVSQHLAAARQQMVYYSNATAQMQRTGGTAAARAAANMGYTQAAAAVNTYTAEQQKLATQFRLTAVHANYLATTYRTSLVGAMVLADQAGVKLGNSLTGPKWALAQLQMANLVRGYQAMGAPAGAVGRDMTVIGIQTGLAATKVSQLNSAWDEFMQNLTGGTSGLAGFVTSLKNIGQVAGTTSNNLGTATGTMKLSTGQFAQALTSFNAKGASAWTNFDQIVGSTAPQLIDWLRIAGAEGAINGQKFQTAILAMTNQLVPFAEKSKTAQTELLGLAKQAGLNIHTWPQLLAKIKSGHVSMGQLSKIVEQATIKMGDMAKVAQQLGTVLQNDIVNVMGQQIIAASGLSKATYQYIQALRQGSASAYQGGRAYNALMHDLEFLGYSAKKARQIIQLLGNEINGLHSKTIYVKTVLQTASGGGGGVTQLHVPGGGGLGAITVPGNYHPSVVHQHIHGSVISEHKLTQHLQGAFNRRTFRNGGTQLFLPGRAH